MVYCGDCLVVVATVDSPRKKDQDQPQVLNGDPLFLFCFVLTCSSRERLFALIIMRCWDTS